ncbi:hypothetical protein COCSADRAFT_80034, partial [Bipolaris sorokiniana ND90Pr]
QAVSVASPWLIPLYDNQPVPIRSPDKRNVDIRHPVPDLQSLQGAYLGNIERLEEHAERMSEAGSDLQEEIRKTYSELKLTDNHRNLPDRPPTSASTDTTHQAHTLWQDFDGVHCPDTVKEESESSPRSRRRHSRPSSYSHSFMDTNLGHQSFGAPPPEDGMVFYPAPVPQMLNLPKRLSQLPPSDTRTRRRTQLLESMQAENRKSMPMNPDNIVETSKPNKRKTRQSLMGLPPQLRASAYFDNQAAPSQEFAVKGDSAQNTLESILDASARAPVSAFTDHPFGGDVTREVYGVDHKRKSSKLPEVPPTLQQTRRRSSFNILDTNHNANGERLKKLKKRNSSADMNLLLVKASENRMSLSDDLDHCDEEERGPHTANDLDHSQNSQENPNRHSDDNDREHEDTSSDEDKEEEDEESEEEEEELQFGAPTTLLAELQLRQAKQKLRNMNYVTLMDQGLIDGRQTLLQMNDVAEAEKQRRIRKKVNLAWEAPGEDDDSEDDVPLGVLYKQTAPNYAPRKIVGLIEQREMEDNEPLSRRRNRLRGADPRPRQAPQLGQPGHEPNLAVPDVMADPISEEEEGETLAERMRRLKEKQQLDAALGDDVRKSTVSGDFAAEMMSKLGVSEGQDEAQDAHKAAAAPGAGEEEEETLGQRRARLQAEAAARGDQMPPAGQRPMLRGASSLADILSANPLDPHYQARKVSNEALISNLPQGSLLHQNIVDEERRKQQRLTAYRRTSGYGPMDPLVPGIGDKEKDDDDDNIPLGKKIQAYKDAHNPITNGQMAASISKLNAARPPSPPPPQPQPQPQLPGMLGMNSMGMMSAPSLNMPMQQPMMGGGMGMGMNMGMPMGMGMNMGMMGGGMRQSTMMGGGAGMPMQMNPMQMNGMGGMQMPMQMQMPMGGGMPMGGMGGGMPMGMPMGMMPGQMMGPPMDPRQRDQIDRWMSGIRN